MSRDNLNKRIRIAMLIISGLVLLNNAIVMAQVEEDAAVPFKNENKIKTAEYVQGELIVKLKDGKTLKDIQELNNQYAVNSTKELFPKTAAPEQVLKELKDKLANIGVEHENWYWQMDKNSQEYKDYQVKIEQGKKELQQQIQAEEELIAHLAQRQQRAPEGIETPKLENAYVLTASQNTDIPAMAKEYSSNPNVEYAEPNYVARIQMIPNDPYYSSKGSWGQDYDDLWGIKKIQADKAWDISQGEGVVVAVVD